MYARKDKRTNKKKKKKENKTDLKLRLEDHNKERRLDKAEEIKNLQVCSIFKLHLCLRTFLFPEINWQR